MISLNSEITDARGRSARCGWLFFDRDCPTCTLLARRFRRPLESRGFGFAALQDPRAQALLNLPEEELLREMRLATSEGEILGGARAMVYLARQIWWARPLYAISTIPGASRLLDAGYRWFADHRTCTSRGCQVPVRTSRARYRTTTAPGDGAKENLL